MKKAKRIISVVLAGIMIFSMAGCGKKNIHQGGEGTNFPYTWKEEWKGTILLKLDGTYGPEDYRWTAESTDETVLEVKEVKKEKKGIATYRVKPLKEGSAQVIFTRQREVPRDEIVESPAEKSVEVETSAESGQASNDEFDMQGYLIEDFGGAKENVQTDERLVVDSSQESEDIEVISEASAYYEGYLDQYRAKDMISEISVRFDAEPTGNKGKLKLNFVLANAQEFKGIMQGTDGRIDYKVWEDDQGNLKVRLPETQGPWDATWEGEYIPLEDPGIPGITVSRPEQVDGKYIILQIQDQGYMEGAHCFNVQGLDQGMATLAFTNSEKKDCLMIEIEISGNGNITVLSHKVVSAQG